MQKLYRQSIRETSGVSKNLQTVLPSPIQKWQGSVGSALDDGFGFVEELLDSAGPRLASGLRTFVRDSRSVFKQFPARISITRLAPDLAGYDPLDYSLSIDMTQPGIASGEEAYSAREGQDGQFPQKRKDSFRRLVVDYGAPIKVKWTAPLNHSKKDWIGLYQVADNASREVTKVSSQGRWIATNRDNINYGTADDGILISDQRIPGHERSDGDNKDYLTGEVEFSGDKLWWTSGVFEFRYHHDGKYNVMAISLPFEIHIPRFIEDDDVDLTASNENVSNISRSAVESALLPMVQNCFDRDPDVSPRTVDEHFGPTLEREGKYARRVVYAVSRMFGIDFAPEVVQADGTVRNLAWRIVNAKKVLAPYSMQKSTRGPSTPT
jgi:phosphatidylethanolamine N-methyltransferase